MGEATAGLVMAGYLGAGCVGSHVTATRSREKKTVLRHPVGAFMLAAMRHTTWAMRIQSTFFTVFLLR